MCIVAHNIKIGAYSACTHCFRAQTYDLLIRLMALVAFPTASQSVQFLKEISIDVVAALRVLGTYDQEE